MDNKLKTAIKTIMNECQEHESCDLCPFYDDCSMDNTCKLA